jgi:hypothetical protein
METTTFKNILVTTDFSELSGNAIKTAAYMCQRQNTRLILINVIENLYLSESTDFDHLALAEHSELFASVEKK